MFDWIDSSSWGKKVTDYILFMSELQIFSNAFSSLNNLSRQHKWAPNVFILIIIAGLTNLSTTLVSSSWWYNNISFTGHKIQWSNVSLPGHSLYK